jgi:hypothetical protein
LYCDRTIRKGKTVIKLAKVAPAPKATNKAGRAQQTNVEEEANKEKKLADLSYMIRVSVLEVWLRFAHSKQSSF